MRQAGLKLSDADYAQACESARRLAYDRYLAALLAPRPLQQGMIILAAFTGEIARIPLTVRDAALAEIRLQWWRDAIGAFGGGAIRTGNPVTDALGDVARHLDLPQDDLIGVLDGFARVLYEDGITGLADFDAFLDETDGAAFRLAARMLGADTPGMNESARAAGAAMGCARLAGSFARYLAVHRLPLPPEVRDETGDPRYLDEAEARKAAVRIVAWLVRKARVELALFRASCAAKGSAEFAAFLPLALVEPTLLALESPRHDVLTASVDIAPLTCVSRIWLAHWKGRI